MSEIATSPGIMLPASVRKSLPSMIAAEVAKLPAAQQSAFLEEYNRKAKNVTTGIILTFCTLHYIYLGKVGLNIVFWLTFGGAGVWWIIDWFRITGMVRDYNRDVATDVMRTMSMIRT